MSRDIFQMMKSKIDRVILVQSHKIGVKRLTAFDHKGIILFHSDQHELITSETPTGRDAQKIIKMIRRKDSSFKEVQPNSNMTILCNNPEDEVKVFVRDYLK